MPNQHYSTTAPPLTGPCTATSRALTDRSLPVGRSIKSTLGGGEFTILSTPGVRLAPTTRPAARPVFSTR